MNHDATNSSTPRLLPDALYTKKGLSAFMRQNDIRFTKSLGQNVFINRNMLKSMVQKGGLPKEGSVLEIGPGIGHLTDVLIERGLRVVAVEKDKAFARLLKERDMGDDILHVVHGDAMQLDFRPLADEFGFDTMIGNLPYNVSVPLLFELTYAKVGIKTLFVMLQKEVGERLIAQPDSKSYGRLSIVLNYLYDVQMIKNIPPDHFHPRPNVESVFIRLKLKPDVDIDFAKTFLERVVHIGFLHRRKKLRKQFQHSIVDKRVFDDELMEKAEREFDLDERAEAWSIEMWVRFARMVEEHPPATQ